MDSPDYEAKKRKPGAPKGFGRPKGRKSSKQIGEEGGIVATIEIADQLEDGETIIHGVDINKHGLTKAEMNFIIEYMNNNMNATLAAQKVYNLKPATARSRAQTLVNSGRIFPVIQLLIKHSINKQLQFSPALLMSNIQTWLQYDILSYYTSDGSAIPLDEIDEDARQLISGVDYRINGRSGARYVVYSLPDKYKALQELSSIVKFLQSLQNTTPEDDSEAARKRDEIFGKPTNYRPVEAE